MFGLLRRRPVDVPVAHAVAVRAGDMQLLEQHAELSDQLGVASLSRGEILRAKFEESLREWGLRVYDAAQVRAFLRSQYGRKDWGFRPLREIDRREIQRWWDIDRNGQIQDGANVYGKPIPYPVLVTVQRVVERFPTARFYVSDECRNSDVRDPFLLVLVDKHEYIIERWDEPNYKER